MTLCVVPPILRVGSLIFYLMNLQATPNYAVQNIGIGYPKNNPISHARRR